jgi:capsular polysaccharide export protein
VEDGFLRSVGLGSDLTQPYSLVFDRLGIYFDPTRPSTLESLLESENFDPDLLARARALRERIVAQKLSKYNAFTKPLTDLPKGRRLILVPGQVEDDASIRFGGGGMGNLELLRRTRHNAPEAYILFKPHPDVLAGNRVGRVEAEVALRYCDRIVTEVSLDAVLSVVDEVHTITSLVGFEALLRGKRVWTYGMPFYAGWGLTRDRRGCERRTRRLTLDQLVAGTLILYPHYLDPETLESCEVEQMLEGLRRQKEQLERSRMLRIVTGGRNRMVRAAQKIGKAIISISREGSGRVG